MSIVYLASLEKADEDLLASLQACLMRLLGLRVTRQIFPETLDYAHDPQRRQYSSSLILRRMVEAIPSDALRLIAVTEKDLFIPMLSFIYGQAQLQGKVAIISLARLRQEFYGLPPDRPLLLARATKEVIHEAGHTLGLVHCLERSCPMSLATNIRQLDLKSDELCLKCGILLQENLRVLKKQSAIAFEVEGRA